MKDVSQKLNELGYRVNVEKLDKIDAVTKAHIAQDIVENEENHSILMKVFGHIPKRGDFIEAIMNEGCPAYVKKQTYTPKEAVKVIRKAGGKAVLAHPICYKYEGHMYSEIWDCAYYNIDRIEKLGKYLSKIRRKNLKDYK